MNPDDAFARILGLIHAAALDDSLWPAASALIDEACGIGGSNLVVGERCGDADRIYFSRYLCRGESREELAREYLTDYYPGDIGMRRLMQTPEGRLVHLPELYTEDERKTSVAYNEGWRRVGGQNGLIVRFDDPDGLRLVWAIGNPEGADGWRSGKLQLIERLLPHVRQYVRVRQTLAAANSLGAGAESLLDSQRIAALRLDRGGRVLSANGPGIEILRRGDGLVERDGFLDALLPAERSRLRQLVARALPRLWAEAPVGGSMTVRRTSSPSRLGVHVSPVGDAQADLGGRRVAALVLAVDPARRPRIDARLVAARLGLKASEGRIGALLAEGMRVREIAAATEWSEDYVRWLAKQAYRKLGAPGQVELVRQVLAVASLPRGPRGS